MKKSLLIALLISCAALYTSAQTISKVEVNDLSESTNPPGVYGEMTDGAFIDLAPEAFSITIVYDGDVTDKRGGFLLEELDAEGASLDPAVIIEDRSEGVAPFVIWGDNSGDYILPEGDRILKVGTKYKLTTYLFATGGTIDDAIDKKVHIFTMGPDSPSSIKDVQSDMVQMYPSPFSNTLQIDAEKGIAAINVYDITGRNIMKIQSDGSTRHTLNTTDLQIGVYLVNVSFNDGTNELIKSMKK